MGGRVDVEVMVPWPFPAFATDNGTVTMKLLALVAVPAGVVTLTDPLAAPAGTNAWIAMSDRTVNVALTPLNVTEVAPVRPEPLIVTLVPTAPLAGAKLAIVGGETTVNAPEL